MRHPLLTLILAAIGGCGPGRMEYEETWCQEWPEAETCPTRDEVDLTDVFIGHLDCRPIEPVALEVLTDPVHQTVQLSDAPIEACCFTARTEGSKNGVACPGRPFQHHGEVVRAPVAHTDPWVELARAEHASIAAFAKLQLDLMALGAPLDLLQRVADALSDEVRHTRLALDEAARLRAEPVEIGPFPFPSPIEPSRDLAAVAYAAVREGCIGETISAVATRRAAVLAEDPHQAEVLSAIADDEDRHAVLSWALVAWALEEGDADVRDPVLRAFAEPAPQLDFPLLPERELRSLETRCLAQIVRPAASQLLNEAGETALG